MEVDSAFFMVEDDFGGVGVGDGYIKLLKFRT